MDDLKRSFAQTVQGQMFATFHQRPDDNWEVSDVTPLLTRIRVKTPHGTRYFTVQVKEQI